MDEVNLSIGDMHFRARRDNDAPPSKAWYAWCARTPNLGDSALDVPFHMDCWFEFAATAEAALAKLKTEVLH